MNAIQADSSGGWTLTSPTTLPSRSATHLQPGHGIEIIRPRLADDHPRGDVATPGRTPGGAHREDGDRLHPMLEQGLDPANVTGRPVDYRRRVLPDRLRQGGQVIAPLPEQRIESGGGVRLRQSRSQLQPGHRAPDLIQGIVRDLPVTADADPGRAA